MVRKETSPHPGYVRVLFELPSNLWADQIFLVGEFNDWACNAHPLRQNRDGAWQVALDLPEGRAYQYRYWIDGRWQMDSKADGSMLDAAGVCNNVVETTIPPAPTFSKKERTTQAAKQIGWRALKPS